MCDTPIAGYKNWETYTIVLELEDSWEGEGYLTPDQVRQYVEDAINDSSNKMLDRTVPFATTIVQQALHVVDWEHLSERTRPDDEEDEDEEEDEDDLL